jgi:hypothetical protein
LAALGLTTDQIGSVMDIFDAEAEQRKSKARARVQKWRDKNRDVTLRNVTETQHSVTKRLARVEDSSSRLDISGEVKKDDASPSAQPKNKATRIPDDFVPNEAWAAEQGLTPAQARVEAAQFMDFWCGKSGKDGTKQDWPATWRVWVRNAIKRLPTARATAPPPRVVHGVTAALARRYQRQEQHEQITEIGSRDENAQRIPGDERRLQLVAGHIRAATRGPFD